MAGEFDKGEYYHALKKSIMLLVITVWGWEYDYKN